MKTTRGSATAAFFVSPNEVALSRARAETCFLVRWFYALPMAVTVVGDSQEPEFWTESGLPRALREFACLTPGEHDTLRMSAQSCWRPLPPGKPAP